MAKKGHEHINIRGYTPYINDIPESTESTLEIFPVERTEH